jgi:hypothetical protein
MTIMEQATQAFEEQPIRLETQTNAPPQLPGWDTPGDAIIPQGCGCGGKGTPAGAPEAVESTYVYALGRIEARFPRPAVEKEFAQAAGRAETAGQTDGEALYAVLSMPENRYLARQMCWVFNVQGLETYLLRPRDPGDWRLLIQAIRPLQSPYDIDVVVGLRGPIASPDVCNGLMVPIVGFD